MVAVEVVADIAAEVAVDIVADSSLAAVAVVAS